MTPSVTLHYITFELFRVA